MYNNIYNFQQNLYYKYAIVNLHHSISTYNAQCRVYGHFCILMHDLYWLHYNTRLTTDGDVKDIILHQ